MYFVFIAAHQVCSWLHLHPRQGVSHGVEPCGSPYCPSRRSKSKTGKNGSKFFACPINLLLQEQSFKVPSATSWAKFWKLSCCLFPETLSCLLGFQLPACGLAPAWEFREV